MATQYDSFDHYVNLSYKWTVGGSHVTIADPTPRATGRVFKPDATPIYHAVDDPGSHINVHIECYIGPSTGDGVQVVVRNSSGAAMVTLKLYANLLNIYLGAATTPAFTVTIALPVQTWKSISFAVQPGSGAGLVKVSLNGETILNSTTATTPAGPITDVGFTGIGNSYIDNFICSSRFDPFSFSPSTLLPGTILCMPITGDVGTDYTQYETAWEPGGNAARINETLMDTASYIEHTIDPVIAPGVGYVSGGQSKDVYSVSYASWPDPAPAPHWQFSDVQMCALAQGSPYPHDTSLYGFWETVSTWSGIADSEVGFLDYPYAFGVAPSAWHYLRGTPGNAFRLRDSAGDEVVLTSSSLAGNINFGLHADDSVGSIYGDISVAHYVLEFVFYRDPDVTAGSRDQFLFIC